jgi:hypothetical protein
MSHPPGWGEPKRSRENNLQAKRGNQYAAATQIRRKQNQLKPSNSRQLSEMTQMDMTSS